MFQSLTINIHINFTLLSCITFGCIGFRKPTNVFLKLPQPYFINMQLFPWCWTSHYHFTILSLIRQTKTNNEQLKNKTKKHNLLLELPWQYQHLINQTKPILPCIQQACLMSGTIPEMQVQNKINTRAFVGAIFLFSLIGFHNNNKAQ